MPVCHVLDYKRKWKRDGSPNSTSSQADDVKLFYQLYGHGPTKVLLIIGLAGTHDAWGPQLLGLCGTDTPNETESYKGDGGTQGDTSSNRLEGTDDVVNGNSHGGEEYVVTLESHGASIEDCLSTYAEGDRKSTYDSKGQSENGIQVCTFDNRGIGKSSIPVLKSSYSTKVMAEDALALLDHLGWQKAHVCGHSMGGMIACKLAAIAPERLSTVALIGVTGVVINAYQRIFKARTPEARAIVDLDTHFTHEYLEALVGEERRRNLLLKEYVRNLSKAGMQPRYGLEGQAYACWKHSLSTEECQRIRSASVMVTVIHGRHDVIAQVEYGRKLAKRLQPVARFAELPGAHLVTHENTEKVNEIIVGMVKTTDFNVQYCEWTDIDCPYDEGAGFLQEGDVGEGLERAVFLATSGCISKLSGSAVSVFRVMSNVTPVWVDFLYIFPSLYWIVLSIFVFCRLKFNKKIFPSAYTAIVELD